MEHPLDETIAAAVNRICDESQEPLDEDAVAERVLQQEDIKILLDGYRMHDRSEGLEDVIIRDIRRKVGEALRARSG